MSSEYDLQPDNRRANQGTDHAFVADPSQDVLSVPALHEAATRLAFGEIPHGRGNAPVQIAMLQRMQQVHGNRAVQRFLHGHSSQSGRNPPIAVQRCGGEIHEGCGCAEDVVHKLAGNIDDEDKRQPIQRQGDNAPAQSGGATATAAPTVAPGDPQYVAMAQADLPPGSPYLSLPKPVLDTLRRSLMSRTDDKPDPSDPSKRIAGNKNLDSPAFWGGKVSSFEDALNGFGTAGINTVVQIYQRGGDSLWNFIKTIQNTWPGGAHGFHFQCTDVPGLMAYLKKAPNFCKDTPIGESVHGGASCWRETVSGGPGLHVCLSGSGEQDVHIDVHQDVKGKGSLGKPNPWLADISQIFRHDNPLLGGGESPLGPICQYDPTQIPTHLLDFAEGKAGVLKPTILERLDTVRDRVASMRDKIDKLAPTNPDRQALLDDIKKTQSRLDGTMNYARDLAVQGQQGERKAENDSLIPYNVKTSEDELEAISKRYDEAAKK